MQFCVKSSPHPLGQGTYKRCITRWHLFILLIGCVLFWTGRVEAIQVTEIMYNPPGNDSRHEFIELYNETASRRDISGWAFVRGIDFVFPEGTVIPPRTYFVVARHPGTLRKKHGVKHVFGPFQGALDNRRERIVLVELADGIMVDVTYNSRGRWPVAPDGTGHSLSKISPRLNANDRRNWRSSLRMGGTPGSDNGYTEEMGLDQPVVINEVLVSSGRQFVELYNRQSKPLALGGYWLSNAQGNLKRYQVPAKTLLPPYGLKHFSENELGFRIKPEAERIFLTTPDGERVVAAYRFTGMKGANAMSTGRYPDGTEDWYVMRSSPGKMNRVHLETDVVINEIMYHPPTNSENDAYLEIYNRGEKSVNLSGWSISGGISFDFPKVTILRRDSYLVIAKARDHLISKYRLASKLVLGDFKGQLSDNGEVIRLRDKVGNKVDEVHYYDNGRWPKYADGYGSSLELIDPKQDNSNYQAWDPSDETKQAEWRHIKYSGRVSNRGRGRGGGSEFHLHLLGAGEMLIDGIQVKATKESILGRFSDQGKTSIENNSFERGLKGWQATGNHIQSHVVGKNHIVGGAAPKQGGNCLKIVATGCGDTGANRIETPLSFHLTRNGTYEISFWAKWQWGNNLLVTRFLNNQVPETHRIPIPELIGTPGRRNSVYQSNLGPAFRAVRHSPVIPRPAQAVQITAHISDPDGVDSVALYYKLDRDRSYTQTAMYDDGKHGDGMAKDGVYGGRIPPCSGNQTVAFYIKAADSKGGTTTWPRDANAPGLYRVESQGKLTDARFPIYRVIMTAEDVWELQGRPTLSNEPLNGTFIFNETDVYYQVKCRYIGSPFGRGGGGVPGYKVRFNADEKLHGVKEQARFDRNNFNYHERIAFDLQRKMRLPTCQQEWVQVRFNGSSWGIWEDILPPGKRYLSIFYPEDSDGQLFEVDDRFVFYGNAHRIGHFQHYDASFAWLDTEDKDSYRWNYEPRNHERADDFTHLIGMLNVINNTPQNRYETEIDKVIDVHQWLRVMAVRTIIADWDFFGGSRGKNAYLYRPNRTGRWELLGWDSELTFEQSNMRIWSNFSPIRQFQMSPKHQHFYYSYIREVLDEYFNVAYLSPWLEHYASIVQRPWPKEMRSFIRARTSYLNRKIPKATAKIEKARTTGNRRIVLEGTAPVQTRFLRITDVDYEPDWVGATNWKLTVLAVKRRELRVVFLDYNKKSVGEDRVRVK